MSKHRVVLEDFAFGYMIERVVEETSRAVRGMNGANPATQIDGDEVELDWAVKRCREGLSAAGQLRLLADRMEEVFAAGLAEYSRELADLQD